MRQKVHCNQAVVIGSTGDEGLSKHGNEVFGFIMSSLHRGQTWPEPVVHPLLLV